MTPENQRIAIAQACGWSIHPVTLADQPDICILPPGVEFTDAAVWNYAGQELPDYLSDLNAMHEAEKALIFSKRQAYRKSLQTVMSRGFDGMFLIDIAECISATAPQRAEAFLRTLGLWEEQEGAGV